MVKKTVTPGKHLISYVRYRFEKMRSRILAFGRRTLGSWYWRTNLRKHQIDPDWRYWILFSRRRTRLSLLHLYTSHRKCRVPNCRKVHHLIGHGAFWDYMLKWPSRRRRSWWRKYASSSSWCKQQGLLKRCLWRLCWLLGSVCPRQYSAKCCGSMDAYYEWRLNTKILVFLVWSKDGPFKELRGRESIFWCCTDSARLPCTHICF